MKKEKSLGKMLADPNNVIEVQKMMLNDLSIKYFKEENADLKKQLKEDIEVLSLATNAIASIDKQKRK